MFRSVVLALALGLAAANVAPSATVNFKNAKLSGGIADNLEADVKLESAVSDDLSVGLNYDHGHSNSIKSVFAKISQKFGQGDVDADLTMDMDDNAITGEIEYTNGDSTVVTHVNSAASQVVESVEYTRKQLVNGLNSMFKPTFHIEDKNVDLEASADLDADTNLLVKLSQGGSSADIEVNHQLDAKTAVKVEAQLTDGHAQVEIEREIDSENLIRPRFDLNNKHLTCAWVRKLAGSRTATVTVDPDNHIDFEIDSDEDSDWKLKATAPLGDVSNPDIEFGRKFQF
jgi:hypothetical protein